MSSKEYKMKKKEKDALLLTKKIQKSMQPFWVGKLKFPNVNWKELADEDVWEKHLNLLSTMYKLNDNNTIPKGTILFHTSKVCDPVGNIPDDKIRPNKPFFFGLDAFISIWYAAETYTKYAYLNVYILEKNLKNVNYIGNDIIGLNPSDLKKCRKVQPCLHPQFGYHSGDLEPPVELSLELTIPSQHIKQSGLKHLLSYEIDIPMLEENEYSTFDQFKATQALRKIIIDCSQHRSLLFI
mgnify:FL=1